MLQEFHFESDEFISQLNNYKKVFLANNTLFNQFNLYIPLNALFLLSRRAHQYVNIHFQNNVAYNRAAICG